MEVDDDDIWCGCPEDYSGDRCQFGKLKYYADGILNMLYNKVYLNASDLLYTSW